MRKEKKRVGIRRKRGGWQAYVDIHGHRHYAQFPLLTDRAVMEEWRTKTKKKFARRVASRGSFSEDIAEYLPASPQCQRSLNGPSTCISGLNCSAAIARARQLLRARSTKSCRCG